MDDPERLIRADRILQELLDAPVDDRARLLEERCAGDPALHTLVGELLDEARTAGEEGDEHLHVDLDARELLDDPRQFIGEQVGNFRLERLLGVGGMGMVFEAARTTGDFEQVAAVKLLTRYGELLAPDARRRFHIERQALARLDHPGIARLIDGGLYRDRVPYLVMEYVNGTNLVRHCLDREAGLERRLELFEALARAVRHAHRQMILHRDIKPGNIMVDREGRIRLLDFGIAGGIGSIDDSGDAGTAYSRWFSAGYTSPEVLAGEPATAASDIYQLGVVLFELVAGRRPYGDAEAHSSQRPAPPASSRVARATGRPWHRRLRGDLDVIIDTMLQRAPLRRYDDIDRVLEDLEAWRRKRPISLRRHSAGYRLHRLIARRWLPLTAGLSLGMLLIVYAATVTWQRNTIRDQARQVAVEARNTQQILDFTRRMISQANPTRTPDLSVTELLLRSVEMAESEFDDRPEIRIQMLVNLAQGLQDTGASRQAERILDQVFTELDGRPADFEDTIRIRAHMATALVRLNLGEWDAVRQSLDAAHALIESLDETMPNLEAEYLNLLTSWQMGTGRLPAARATQERLRELGAQHELAHELEIYALSYRASLAFNPAESVALQREVLARERAEYGDQHPLTAQAAMDLATFLGMVGAFDEALELWRYSLPLQERFFGSNHFRRVQTLTNYAYILIMTGRLDAARTTMEEAASILSRRGESVSLRTLTVATGLGWLDALDGDFAAAEARLSEPVDMMLSRLGPNHQVCLQPVTALAGVHFYRGDAERAWSLLQTCDREAVRDHVSSPMVLFMTRSLEARLLLARGQNEAAYRMSGKLLEAIRGQQVARLWPGYDLQVTHAHAALALGRDDEGRRLLDTALDGLTRTLGDEHWITRRARRISQEGPVGPAPAASTARRFPATNRPGAQSQASTTARRDGKPG